MCSNYHNEVKIVLRFKFFDHLRKKSFAFSGFDPGTFRSQVDNTAPRPRSQ